MSVLALGLWLSACALPERELVLVLPDAPALALDLDAGGLLQATRSGGTGWRLDAPAVRVRRTGRWQAAGDRLQTQVLDHDGVRRWQPVWQGAPGEPLLEAVEWSWRLHRLDGRPVDDARWTQIGYAKYSPAGVVRVRKPLPLAADGSLAGGFEDPSSGLEPIIRGTTPDGQRGWWMSSVQVAADAPLLGFGACSARRWKTRLGIGVAADGGLELRLRQGGPGDSLPATTATPLETICVTAGLQAEAVDAALAAAFESRWTPRPAQASPRFFSTWHADFFHLDFAAVEAEIAALARAGYSGEFDGFQLDDGWQPRWGDWMQTRTGFGADLTATAARIDAAGYRPGIWLTPSVADPGSSLLQRHPDWILRDSAGQPVRCGLCSMPWPELVALDWSHSEVPVWFSDVLGLLQDAGFRMFKLDFLVYSAAEGLGFDPSTTALDRYNRMLETVRDALRPGSLAWTATHPIWPTLGALDGQRISADLGFEFFEELPWTNRMMYARALGIRGGWLSRFGQIDPDAFFARNQPDRLAREGLAALAAMSGSMYSIGDRPADIDDSMRPDHLPAALRTAIGSGVPFRPADPLAHAAEPWVPFGIVEAFLGADAWAGAQDALWWRHRAGGLDLVVLDWQLAGRPVQVDLTPVLQRMSGEGNRAILRRVDGGPRPELDGTRLRIAVDAGHYALLRLDVLP